MAPKMRPVSTAAGTTPSQRRSAVKQKPRKNSSWAIGAATHTSTATATSAEVESSAPSSFGRSSFCVTFSAAAQIAENTKKASHTASSQPAARRGAVGRRPKSLGRGRPAVSQASTTAAKISPASWMNVPAIVTPGGGSLDLTSVPATWTPSATSETPSRAMPSVTSIAANGAQPGQRGRPSSFGGASGAGPGGGAGGAAEGGTLVTGPE